MRITEKNKDGVYSVMSGFSTDNAIEKLGKYEDILDFLRARIDKIAHDMETMKADNKTKTATYKQLLAEKLTIINVLNRFNI